MQIKLLSQHAKTPSDQGDKSNAGYDLYAAHEAVVQPGQRTLIKTDISLAIPFGYYGRIAPRSGLAFKNGIDVLAGVIDSGYRDNIGVILLNTGDKPFYVATGDRIAQIIFERCYKFDFDVTDELPESIRGNGGFGSTGV